MALLDDRGGAEFPYAKADVFQAVKLAVRRVRDVRLSPRGDNKLAGVIKVMPKYGAGAFSQTQRITIAVSELAPRRTRLSILSKPKTGILLGVGDIDTEDNRWKFEAIIAWTSYELQVGLAKRDESYAPSAQTVEQRLDRLRSLLQAGRIDAAEYQQIKSAMLKEA